MISDATEAEDRRTRVLEIRMLMAEDEKDRPKHPGIDRAFLAGEEAKKSKHLKDLQDPDATLEDINHMML
jgi:hypothetical protein